MNLVREFRENLLRLVLVGREIATELHESVMVAMNDGRAFERELLSRHPIGRFGDVTEVADACVFLCAAEARFLTGANISIDGGYSRV